MDGKKLNFILCDFQSRKSKYLPTAREGNFSEACVSHFVHGGMMSLPVWSDVLFGGLPLRRRGLPLRSSGGGFFLSGGRGVLPPGDPPQY